MKIYLNGSWTLYWTWKGCYGRVKVRQHTNTQSSQVIFENMSKDWTQLSWVSRQGTSSMVDQYSFYSKNCTMIWTYLAISSMVVIVLFLGYDLGVRKSCFSSIRSKMESVGRKFWVVAMIISAVQLHCNKDIFVHFWLSRCYSAFKIR